MGGLTGLQKIACPTRIFKGSGVPFIATMCHSEMCRHSTVCHSTVNERVVCLAKTHYLVAAFPHTFSDFSRLFQ